MSKKFIPQIPNNNFVYPNNDKVEYDQEIIHDINNNTVTGSITGVSLSQGLSAGTIDLGYTWFWSLNGAKRALTNGGSTAFISVHMMTPDQDYFKPWRMVDHNSGSPTATTAGSIEVTNLSPSDFGVSSFPFGEYKFEFRIIGEEQVTPICVTATLQRFTCVCTSYTVTNNSTENVAIVEWEDCDSGQMVANQIQPTQGISFCGCEGSVSSPTVGADITITNLGPCDTPTPTPSPSPTFVPSPTPPPSPSPTPTNNCTFWRLEAPTFSGEDVSITYTPCEGGPPQQYSAYWGTGTHFVCAVIGSVTINDIGIDGSATDTGTPCT